MVWKSPLGWLLLWAALQVLARWATIPSLELDEAEQMVWSQDLLWGYGSQPPLYTWLQWAFNAVLGPGVWSLSVLKLGLIVGTVVLMALAAREVLPARMAWWAAGGLFFLPQMVWESLRDLTHTVLLTGAVAATWYLTLRQINRPDRRGFVLLGVAVACGVLSKYSFGLFAVVVALAVASVPSIRHTLWAPGWWWTPLVAAVLLAPHGLWLSDHWQLASARTLGKLDVAAAFSPWMGFSNLAVAFLANVLLWVLVWGALFKPWRARAQAPQGRDTVPPWAPALFARYFLLLLAVLAGMVLLGHVTQFKDRWVYPLICVLPLACLCWLPGVEASAVRRYPVVLAVWLLVLGGLIAARPWYNGYKGKRDEINEPVAALVQQIRSAGYDGVSPILASDGVAGGNLRLHFPQARVWVCEPSVSVPSDCALPTGQRVLQVARLTDPGAAWWGLVDRAQPVQPIPLELPYVYAGPGGPVMRYQWVW